MTINGANFTVTADTLCNDGSVEKYFTGGAPSGWSLGALSSGGSGWTETRTFNAGPVGASSEGNPDSFDSNAFGTVYSDEQSTGNGLVGKIQVRNGQEDFGYWGGTVTFPEDLGEGDEFWISFDYYVPASYIIRTDTIALKFIRVNQNNGVNSNAVGKLDWAMITDIAHDNWANYAFIMTKEGLTPFVPIGDFNTTIPRDQWFNVEVYAKLDSDPALSGGGVMRMWIDGVLIGDAPTQTLENPAHIATGFYLGTYWNGGAPQDQHTYIDNLVITSQQPSNTDSNGYHYIGASN